MADILLVYPNPSYESPQRNAALSIFFPGVACQAAGMDVAYWDARFDGEFELEVKVKRAGAIGISAMTGVQVNEGLRLAAYCRTWAPTAPIIWGGVHATVAPEQTVKHPLVDYVIAGEGERRIVHLLERWTAMDGIYSKAKSQPATHLLDLSTEYVSPITKKTMLYFALSEPILPTSRGCPFRCTFCCVPILYHGKWRPVPFDAWCADAEVIISLRDPDIWEFNDENTLSLKHILPYLTFVKNLGVEGHCHIRADMFHDGYSAAMLREAGCRWVHIGAESGSQRVLNLMNKQETPEHFIHAAERLSEVGIGATFTFIVGAPTETRQEREQTFRLAELLGKIMHGDCRMNFYPWMPIPGSEFYQKGLKLNLFEEPTSLEGWRSWEPLVGSKLRKVYFIGGLAFNSGKSGKTRQNFPGLWRVLIFPFEILAKIRFKLRWFHKSSEMNLASKLIKWRSKSR